MEIIGSIILAITHSILFYGKQIGISMIIFETIFNVVMLYILHKKNKIQNKAGILLLIPVFILSSTFFIFANNMFYVANIAIIFILNLLMYVITTNNKDYLSNHLYNTFELFSSTIAECNESAKYTKEKAKENIKVKNTVSKEVLKKFALSLLIVIPVVGLVLILLVSADSIFANLFSGIEQLLSNINAKTIWDMTVRIVIMVIIYLLTLSLIFKLQNKYQREEYLSDSKKRDTFTIKMLLATLNFIYLIFCFIQVSSLFGKMNIDSNFDYATYARTGFFQLMFVSFINFIVLLVSNKYNQDREKSIQLLSLLLIIFTVIIAISSMYRMYLYETEYGLTYLRMFVYVILVTELICFIPTIVYLFKKKFDFMKWCMAIGLTSYCIVNCMNIENTIINKNLNRNSMRSVDYTYISRIASEDSYEALENKFKSSTNEEEKEKIAKIIFQIMEDKKDLSWQEFNISKYKLKDKDNKAIIQELNLTDKDNNIKNSYKLRNAINEDRNIN